MEGRYGLVQSAIFKPLTRAKALSWVTRIEPMSRSCAAIRRIGQAAPPDASPGFARIDKPGGLSHGMTRQEPYPTGLTSLEAYPTGMNRR